MTGIAYLFKLRLKKCLNIKDLRIPLKHPPNPLQRGNLTNINYGFLVIISITGI